MSNEVLEVNRYKLKLNSQKLLFGLAQSIDHTIDMFPEFGIDINGLFDFLDIRETHNRHQIIRDAFFDITSNPLQKKISDKKWSTIPWLSAEYDEEESKFVKICFTEKAKPYLLKLKQYTKIKGLHITKLSSTYATWLYPVLKMIQDKYHGKHPISIERLKEYTFTDDKKKYPAYNTVKMANTNFLKAVLGITKNRQSKQFEILKKSPLWEINEKTDIIVTAEIIKERQRYIAVKFSIKNKNANVNKSKYLQEFGNKSIGITRTSIKEMYANARASNMQIQDYCERAGYQIKGNYAVKYQSEKDLKRMREIRDRAENKRSYRQMSIDEIIKKK